MFHPASVEKYITRHAEVKSALLVGTRQPQAALLVTMAASVSLQSAEERSKAISILWPTIVETNLTCPVYAKLAKEHIEFTHPQKPMVKTARGTVQRSATINLHEEELDLGYARAAPVQRSCAAVAHTLIMGGRDL